MAQQTPTDLNIQTSLSKGSLEKATISYIHVNEDKRIVYANPFACDTFGYTLKEFLGRTILDIGNDLTEESWDALWHALCEKSHLYFTDTYIRKDASLLPIEARLYLMVGPDGCWNRSAGMFIEDLTEKRKVESDALLKQFIFQQSATAILIGRGNGEILDVNEQACSYLGYTKEELCGMTVFELDASFSKGEVGEIFDNTQAQHVLTFESTHRRKDGTVYPVEITANALEYNGTELSICFFKDISERKRGQAQKAKAEEQLQKAQKLEALGILAGGIAHDFNNILSGVMGYAELVKISLNPQDEIRKYIQPIIDAGQRAKRLVRQIMDFSRQEQAKKAPTDLSQVIRESANLIRASIPSTIEMVIDIAPKLGLVLADETMIHQIVMNLCTNAYHAIEEKGRVGKLQVGLSSVALTNEDCLSFPELSPGRYLKLIVADTGRGIDKATITKIFDPYFTTKKSGEGTGLGLSVVHGIIKSHHGAIRGIQ